jgi:hypothetical protein
MIRKLTLGLVAAASLAATSLIPTAASAGGGWGWHHHHHHGHFFGGPAFVVGTGYGYGDGCLQRRFVETRRGLRVRWVNVCAY